MTIVKSASKLDAMINHKKYKPLIGYLSVSEVAKIIGKSRQATYRHIIRRKLHVIKIGEIIIVHKSELPKLR